MLHTWIENMEKSIMNIKKHQRSTDNVVRVSLSKILQYTI